MKVAKPLLLFFTISLLHLIGEGSEMDLLIKITKPLIMASLILYFKTSVKETPYNRFVILGLGFSLVGDSLLLFQESNSVFFLGGLGAFLMAHLIYSWINFNLVLDAERKVMISWKDLPILAIGFVVFLFIKEDVGALQIPVLSYIVVIAIMAITARQRWKRADNESFWLIISGALFFMFSDTLLAMNKFVEPFPQSGISIMLTYMVAQFLIVRGMIVFIQKIRPEAGS